MSLSARQITLIQNSFTKVKPIADQAADIFYNKLFEYDPSLRQLFKNDMKQQGRMLMSVLGTAVGSLNKLEALIPTLQKLAKQHVEYGVKADDYTPVGNALLYTLKQGLGPAFTPELRLAWIEVYKVVATTMREAAYPNFNAKTYRNTKRYNR